MSNLFNYFIEGSILGLATGVSCAAFCLPVLLGLTARNVNNATPLIDLSFFLLGRLISYLLVALIFSYLGVYLSIFAVAKSIIKIMIAFILLYWGIKGFIKIDKNEGLCMTKKYAKTMPFIAGVLTGISPCPPFIAGITRVVNLASPLIGTIYFIGFYLSTSIFLIPGLFSYIFKYKKELKILAIFISIIFGIIFLVSGIIEML